MEELLSHQTSHRDVALPSREQFEPSTANNWRVNLIVIRWWIVVRVVREAIVVLVVEAERDNEAIKILNKEVRIDLCFQLTIIRWRLFIYIWIYRWPDTTYLGYNKFEIQRRLRYKLLFLSYHNLQIDRVFISYCSYHLL